MSKDIGLPSLPQKNEGTKSACIIKKPNDSVVIEYVSDVNVICTSF
jgi:hypothetical protein